MSTRLFARLSGLVGIVGVVMQIGSYRINPGPTQANPTQAQMAAFGVAYHTQIMVGGWLQAVGTTLCIAFAIVLIHLAGATRRFAGSLTVYGGLLLTAISLVEVALYFSAATGTQAATPLISEDIIHALQRMYFVVTAPAVFFPLGYVIINSRVLPRALGYAAIGLAILFAALGIADLFIQLQAVDDILGSVQSVWWLLAAIALLVVSGKYSTRIAVSEPEPALV